MSKYDELVRKLYIFREEVDNSNIKILIEDFLNCLEETMQSIDMSFDEKETYNLVKREFSIDNHVSSKKLKEKYDLKIKETKHYLNYLRFVGLHNIKGGEKNERI